MERIKTYYNNTMNVDGAVEYGFRRNKREIEKTIKYNGLAYELIENLDGYGKALVYRYNDYLSDRFVLLSYNTIKNYKITDNDKTEYLISLKKYESLNKKEILKIKEILKEV